ncbi:MAG: DUF1330 domain-containing protein [Thermodesulfobacteriota bacterium]|nr:DUF1330 domain-containing protein [Thermodesulfobacteriota bacterium]
MGAINPEEGQIREVIEGVPKGVPVVMLNMLKFREKAAYPDGRAGVSGEEAYAAYTRAAFKQVQKVGGELVWFGDAKASVIGPPDEAWDQVFLVRYPSIEKFFEMVNSAAYQEVVVHRTSALLDSRLIAVLER